jgi:1-acyl-sn-glycerol-3-phosphate acyltransferase
VQIKEISYRAGQLLVRLVFGCVARVQVIGFDKNNCRGGFLLAANHISHFDPFLISLAVRRKIDWMTMAEFYRIPLIGFFLRAVDTFPAERDRADSKTIGTAIERLKAGRIVGLFPEGGIRDGLRSVLEGAQLRPGAATLAYIAGVPIVPCVILGTDRYYSRKAWIPFRRTPIWIAFGKPISYPAELPKPEARERIQTDLAAAFRNLYAELRERFSLTPDDLPHPPGDRISGSRASASLAAVGNGNRSVCPTIHTGRLHRLAASAVDALLCASLNLLHTRHRLNGRSREQMEQYVAECERLTPREYYSAASDPDLVSQIGIMLGSAIRDGHSILTWRSPITTQFERNNTACAEFFPAVHDASGAQTMILLHALMSTSPVGYRRCARRFNEMGWNVCFVHLPYHYSRVPQGYWNGELAITSDLIRNAEGLRQGVSELRQLMEALRMHGCSDFGVLATSYGAWNGALLATTESDLRFVALMAPIVDLDHAIWASPAARLIRRELNRANIEPSLVTRHFYLSSPLHCQPLCDPARVLFVTGEFDSIAPTSQIEAIHRKWAGSELLRVRQGHFGYRMMRDTIARLKQRGDLQPKSDGLDSRHSSLTRFQETSNLAEDR